jgi:O-acetyl-ADP-ribose deacetylase (regulator of RNase III)
MALSVELFKGDITSLDVDAVVNAANNHLWMGAGVAGAIKRAGGQTIEDEAKRQGPIPVGEAVITGGGQLEARYVIHAAVMGQDLRTDAAKIAAATENSLLRAEERGLRSVAFPAFGTGVGGFPVAQAAETMLSVICEHLKSESSLERVVFALFSEDAYKAFEKALADCQSDPDVQF